MMMRCKFSDRPELWMVGEISSYLPNYKFGRMISREMFEALKSTIRFSRQQKDSETYDERNQWQLCEGFVDAINAHRKEYVHPSHFLCVDESILR